MGGLGAVSGVGRWVGWLAGEIENEAKHSLVVLGVG